MKRGESAVGIKNVTRHEPQFTGHFPTQPVMPGVMIVESMAQTAAAVVVPALGPDAEGKLVYFMTIDEERFRRPVVPGDRKYIHVTAFMRRGSICKLNGEGIGRVSLRERVCLYV